MGPVSAKSYPGQQAIPVTLRPAERATQEIDYGRRGKGYVYGALWETTGDCWTQCYEHRCKADFIDFLCYVDSQVPQEVERIYAIMDNLDMHHCNDLLLFMVHHERWEFVYQPKYAAYLNLIEPMPGKRSAPWRSKGGVLKPGRKWSRRLKRLPPTGTRTSTRMSGASVVGISPRAVQALLCFQKWRELGECTTKYCPPQIRSN